MASSLPEKNISCSHETSITFQHTLTVCPLSSSAENIAKKFAISRAEQDEYACRSQRLAGAAMEAGRFTAQVVPVPVQSRKGVTEVATDEFPRPETTTDTLAKLRPAFITVSRQGGWGVDRGAGVTVI